MVKRKEHVMVRQIVISGLLLVGVVAMMGTEVAAQWSYCFGCLSGDKCKLDFKTGGLVTGQQIKNGLVSADCNNRFDGGKVLDAIVKCRNQGGTVALGFPVQGNADATFDIEQQLTNADINGSQATKQLPIETSFFEAGPPAAGFCVNPPATCASVCHGTTDDCNAFSTTSSCYACFKVFFDLPPESTGCPNANWRYDSIDYNNHCVNFRVFLSGVEEISVTRRCTDPGNTNFVQCVEDKINCPFCLEPGESGPPGTPPGTPTCPSP